MDDRPADCKESMRRTLEELRTQLRALATEKEEQEAAVKLLDLFRKTLIDENRLLCELRDRGAECISGNVSYSSDNQNFFRDLEGNIKYNSDGRGGIFSRWEEIKKQGGLNSNQAGSLVGDYEGYRVCKNDHNNPIIVNTFPSEPDISVNEPDISVKIGEWHTNPHEFDLRFGPSLQYFQNWEEQPIKEEIVRKLGTYLVRIFRTLFVKTLQSDNFFPEESCFDNLRDAWCKAIEMDGGNLMVLLPSRNYLTHFEKYKEAFDCSIERHHVIPYYDEIPEAKYGFIFSPKDVYILLHAKCAEFVDDSHRYIGRVRQGLMLTGFHFSHPEHIVRFKCPPDET
jgi:hypothetical protein